MNKLMENKKYNIYNKEITLINLRKRDSQSFIILYNKYKKRVYNYLLIKTNLNRDIADEVFCDTFYYAWISISKIKNTKNLYYWLITIACRKLSDYLRRQYKEENYIKYFIGNIKDDEQIDRLNDYIYNKKLILMVNIALDNIKPLYRKLLKLKYYEKKSQKEIAVVLDTTEASVQCKLYRARRALKNVLKRSKYFINYEN